MHGLELDMCMVWEEGRCGRKVGVALNMEVCVGVEVLCDTSP